MQRECLLSQGTALWGPCLAWTVCRPCPQHLGGWKHTEHRHHCTCYSLQRTAAVPSTTLPWGFRKGKGFAADITKPSRPWDLQPCRRDFLCGAGAEVRLSVKAPGRQQSSGGFCREIVAWSGSRAPRVAAWPGTARLTSLKAMEHQESLWPLKGM